MNHGYFPLLELFPCSRHLLNPQGLPPAQRMLGRLRRGLRKEASPCRPRPRLGSRRPRPTGFCSTGQPLPGSMASSPGGESQRQKGAQRGAGQVLGPGPSSSAWRLQVQP